MATAGVVAGDAETAAVAGGEGAGCAARAVRRLGSGAGAEDRGLGGAVGGPVGGPAAAVEEKARLLVGDAVCFGRALECCRSGAADDGTGGGGGMGADAD